VVLSLWTDRIRYEIPGQPAWRSQDTDLHIGGGPLRICCSSSLPRVQTEVIRLRTLVLAVFLIAWLAIGIISGVVMGRRHDRLLGRFPWLLLGAASGALIVPLALGAGRREEPIGQPTPPLGWQDRPPSVLVAIDDSQEGAAAPSGGLLDSNERKAG
jgi:hypothetical protein